MVQNQQTQIEKLVEEIKKAKAAGVPIVYIPTNEKELITKMLFGTESCFGSIVPILKYDGNAGDAGAVVEVTYSEHVKTDYSKSNYRHINVINEEKPVFTERLENAPHLWYSFTYSINIEETIGFNNVVTIDSFIKDWCENDSISYRQSLWIIVTPTWERVPEAIAPYVRTVHVPALTEDEIRKIVETALSDNGISLKNDIDNLIVKNMRGFSASRITQIMNQLIRCQSISNENGFITDEVKVTINQSKKEMMAGCPGTKWEDTDGFDAVGLDKVTNWINDHKDVLLDSKKAKAEGKDIPKGILITGIPGSGKSLMAKTVARELDRPLISLNMGELRGKYQGDSEHHMREALNLVEKIEPCILWIDEIEKAFGSSDKNEEDSVGQRLFGTFLTWMQEKTADVFVFCTANDTTKLPPELFRSERFDRKFCTFMPTKDECAKIFASILKQQNEKYHKMYEGWTKSDSAGKPKHRFSEDLLKESYWENILDECCNPKKQPIEFDDSQPLVEEIYAPKKDDDGFYEVKYKEVEGERRMLWKDHNPAFKLLSGADIASIIKETKARTLKKQVQKEEEIIDSEYDSVTFEECVREVITEFRPYGQTNLRDIAKCFGQLHKNQFEFAGNSTLFDFEKYDDNELCYICKKSDLDSIPEGYDKVLFYTVVGAINRYLPKIDKEEKGRRK